jgi:hypothetical protein
MKYPLDIFSDFPQKQLATLVNEQAINKNTWTLSKDKIISKISTSQKNNTRLA